MRLVPELPLPPAPHRPGAPRPTLAIPADPARAFRWGVDLLNHGFAWEAHEVWEARWREAAGDERRLLQGLIQLAAARLASALGRSDATLLARAAARLVPPFPASELGRAAAQLAADPMAVVHL